MKSLINRKVVVGLLGCLTALSLAGCSSFNGAKGDAGTAGATGPAGPKLTGNWVGYVALLNSSKAFPADKSDITVTVSNPSTLSSAALSAPITATTNADGKFVIKNLESGIYTLTFSKTGYADKKVYNAQFIGGGDVLFDGKTSIADNIILISKAGFEVSTVNLTSTASSTLTISCFTNLTPGTFGNTGRHVRIFIGTTNSVSSTPGTYVYTKDNSFSGVNANGSTSSPLSIYIGSAGLSTGVTYYAVLYSSGTTELSYGSTYLNPDYYFDPTVSGKIYSSLGSQKSNVISFKL